MHTRPIAVARPAFAAISIMVLTGCGGDHGGPASVVRDSAGVALVESRRPAWEAGEAWRVDHEPAVEIGVLDGEPAYQLYGAWSAVRLDDGRIVVANGGTGELRFYDADGRHLGSVGRPGEGPGEFQDLQRVWRLPGDSLLAYDFIPARLSVFTPGGDYVRSIHVAAPDGRQVVIRGRFDDGSIVAMGAPTWAPAGATSGVVRDSVPFFRYDGDGAFLGILGRFPAVEVYRMVTDEGWRLTGLPFARTPVALVHGDRLHFGPADAYALETYSPAGELRRIIRVPHATRRVTAADFAAFRAERLERAEREGTRPRMERMLAQIPVPETMPPYEALLVDDEGQLWVREYRARPDEPSRWRIFSDDGAYLGDVLTPTGLEVHQIGPDFVLGRWRDELDVEHIRMHRLSRPVSASGRS